jgi:hypothetical protein
MTEPVPLESGQMKKTVARVLLTVLLLLLGGTAVSCHEDLDDCLLFCFDGDCDAICWDD